MKKREPEFDVGLVRDISEAVFRDRMGSDDIARLIAKHGEEKVRERASSYDVLTRCYLRHIGMVRPL